MIALHETRVDSKISHFLFFTQLIEPMVFVKESKVFLQNEEFELPVNTVTCFTKWDFLPATHDLDLSRVSLLDRRGKVRPSRPPTCTLKAKSGSFLGGHKAEAASIMPKECSWS